LVADAGRAIYQAVYERGSWILKDLLRVGLSARLRPVVILHRDHEHRFHTMIVVTIVVAVIRIDGETSTPHRSGQRQRAHGPLKFWIKHSLSSSRSPLLGAPQELQANISLL